MKNCINQYIKSKTMILVTHAIHFLNYMDRIIYMKDGEIVFNGKYDDLKNQDFYIELTNKIELEKKTSLEQELSELELKKKKSSFTEKTKDSKKDDEVVKLINEDDEDGSNIKLEVYFKFLSGLSYKVVLSLLFCNITLFKF